jgi:hypothetical protein
MASITDDVDFDSIDPATEEAINKAIESGDLDAMNALLNGGSIEEISNTDEETGEESAASGETESEKSEETTETEAEEKTEEDLPAVVATRDGKRVIPYEVLSSAREQGKQLAAENAALKQKLAEQETHSQNVTKFLTAKGIDPEQITDAQAAAGLSKEEMEQLDELDPVIGKAIRLLNENVAASKQQLQQSNAVPPEVQALQNNADLFSWEKSDPDRFDFACLIDDKLKVDPKFKDASLADRFAEVARRTKVAFGDTSEAPAQSTKKINETAQKKVDDVMSSSVPRSLSNLGVTPSAERSPIEMLAEKDASELLSDMANMHPDKLMAMLQQIE